MFRGVSAVGLRFFGLVHLFEVARTHAELFVEQPAEIRRGGDAYGVAHFVDLVFPVLQHAGRFFQTYRG